MKDLLSRERCCYKIHTTLMKSSASIIPSKDNHPTWITHHSPSLARKSRALPPISMIFQKSLSPINIKGVHTTRGLAHTAVISYLKFDIF